MTVHPYVQLAAQQSSKLEMRDGNFQRTFDAPQEVTLSYWSINPQDHSWDQLRKKYYTYALSSVATVLLIIVAMILPKVLGGLSHLQLLLMLLPIILLSGIALWSGKVFSEAEKKFQLTSSPAATITVKMDKEQKFSQSELQDLERCYQEELIEVGKNIQAVQDNGEDVAELEQPVWECLTSLLESAQTVRTTTTPNAIQSINDIAYQARIQAQILGEFDSLTGYPKALGEQ